MRTYSTPWCPDTTEPVLIAPDSGNALTDGFLKDVGITQDEYDLGNQLLYVGIIVLEVCVLVYPRLFTILTNSQDTKQSHPVPSGANHLDRRTMHRLVSSMHLSVSSCSLSRAGVWSLHSKPFRKVWEPIKLLVSCLGKYLPSVLRRNY